MAQDGEYWDSLTLERRTLLDAIYEGKESEAIEIGPSLKQNLLRGKSN